MRPSPPEQVRRMYDETAGDYAQMMDAEIRLPVYADVLGRLRDRIADLPGSVIDTACGSGHMLERYHKAYDQGHPLVGVDLSPRMVDIAAARLGSNARVVVGDMRDLSWVASGSCSAVVNFYALHHVDAEDVQRALRAWHRILADGGQLLLATWEGSGTIDYGDAADLVAMRYTSRQVTAWVQQTGFRVTRCVVEPVEDMPMDAVYLEASKPGPAL